MHIPVPFCLLLGMCISINLLCVGFCVYGFVLFFCWNFIEQVLLNFSCACPLLCLTRDSFFTFSVALAVFAGCIDNATSLSACLLRFP